MKKSFNFDQNKEEKPAWLINGKTLKTNDKNKEGNWQID